MAFDMHPQDAVIITKLNLDAASASYTEAPALNSCGLAVDTDPQDPFPLTRYVVR